MDYYQWNFVGSNLIQLELINSLFPYILGKNILFKLNLLASNYEYYCIYILNDTKPLSADRINAVLPALLLWFTFAPFWISFPTICVCPEIVHFSNDFILWWLLLLTFISSQNQCRILIICYCIDVCTAVDQGNNNVTMPWNSKCTKMMSFLAFLTTWDSQNYPSMPLISMASLSLYLLDWRSLHFWSIG